LAAVQRQIEAQPASASASAQGEDMRRLLARKQELRQRLP
jgi:hypothetical protein